MARSCTRRPWRGWHDIDQGRPQNGLGIRNFTLAAKRQPVKKLFSAAFAAVIALIGGAAQAQTAWPAKPITLVVPFPPGGGTDAFARPLSAQLSKQLGRQVIIDNPGVPGVPSAHR